MSDLCQIRRQTPPIQPIQRHVLSGVKPRFYWVRVAGICLAAWGSEVRVRLPAEAPIAPKLLIIAALFQRQLRQRHAIFRGTGEHAKNSPQHAAVFRLDEKSGVHALDRLDRVLPLSPGRAERHGFEYYRHGTLSRFAALNTRTGTVRGQTAPCHTTEEFVAFLAQLVALAPPGRESTSCWITLPVTKLSAFPVPGRAS